MTPLVASSDIKSNDFDGIVVVADGIAGLPFDEVKTPLKVIIFTYIFDSIVL